MHNLSDKILVFWALLKFPRVVLTLQEYVEMRHINLKGKIREKGTHDFEPVRVLNSDPEPVTPLNISRRALGNLLQPTATPKLISFLFH